MIPLLGPGSMLCRIKKFVMHFQVKSLSGKSFPWSESMGPANLYSGLQKLPRFCGCKKGLITLNHWHHFGVDKESVKKRAVFQLSKKANPKNIVCFLIFQRSLHSYEPIFDFTKTCWLYTTWSEYDQFLSNPFLVFIGWKFEHKPLLDELYWAFGLYSAMKNWPSNINLCKPL